MKKNKIILLLIVFLMACGEEKLEIEKNREGFILTGEEAFARAERVEIENSSEQRDFAFQVDSQAPKLLEGLQAYSTTDQVGNKIVFYLSNKFSEEDLVFQEAMEVDQFSKVKKEDLNKLFNFESNGFLKINYPKELSSYQLVVAFKSEKEIKNVILYDSHNDNFVMTSFGSFSEENDFYRFEFMGNEEGQIIFGLGSKK